jgi:hypothetical protein
VKIRFRKIAKASLASVLVLSIVGWLYLYTDSIVKRRRAERLISGLKSFPYSTAGFSETRDFVDRNGGTALVQYPDVNLSAPNPPVADENGHTLQPTVETFPRCDKENCAFEIWVKPRSFVLASMNHSNWRCSLLTFLGLRPWVSGGRFEVAAGHIKKVSFSVSQVSIRRIEGERLFVPVGYTVSMFDDQLDQAIDGFWVDRPHISIPVDALSAKVEMGSKSAIKRGMDVQLLCLTDIFQSCGDVSEIAPSAWAQFSKEQIPVR